MAGTVDFKKHQEVIDAGKRTLPAVDPNKRPIEVINEYFFVKGNMSNKA